MGIPTMAYVDNEAAARGVYEHIRDLTPPIRHLRLRPYDYRNRPFTDWWLVPSPDWPVYRYGKYYFRRVPSSQSYDDPGIMSTGFYLERGFGRQVADMVDPELITQPNWFWYRFLNDSLGGVLDAPMREVLQRVGQPLVISLDLYTFDHTRAPAPDGDWSHLYPDDRLTYVLKDESLMLSLAEGAENELARLNQAGHLRELVLQIEAMQDLKWYWIDVYLGVRLRYATEPSEGQWSAAKLWHSALEPWLRWVH
ncbi:MAG: hypothetical protein ACP5HG_03085 [Anaerolineae bacterium]